MNIILYFCISYKNIMTKLIKISKDNYIVVDDSEIKVGDWYYSNLGINRLGETTRYVEEWRNKIKQDYENPTENNLDTVFNYWFLEQCLEFIRH